MIKKLLVECECLDYIQSRFISTGMKMDSFVKSLVSDNAHLPYAVFRITDIEKNKKLYTVYVNANDAVPFLEMHAGSRSVVSCEKHGSEVHMFLRWEDLDGCSYHFVRTFSDRGSYSEYIRRFRENAGIHNIQVSFN